MKTTNRRRLPACPAAAGKVIAAALLAAALAAPAGALAQGAARPFDCLIEPSQVVEVRSVVDGLIASVHVKRGDVIRRGQPLVELQSATERVAVEAAHFRSQMDGQIASAKNRVRYATAKLARLTELQKDRYASAQSRDEAEAELRLAESELVSATESRELARIEWRRAREQLAQRTMFAPFNGIVLDRMLHPGDLAEAGAGRKAVLRVAQIDPLKVEIVVPTALFGSIKPGAQVVLNARALPARHVAAVTVVDKLIDVASGTYIVRADLPNPGHAIAGGVRCTAEFGSAEPRPPARAAH